MKTLGLVRVSNLLRVAHPATDVETQSLLMLRTIGGTITSGQRSRPHPLPSQTGP